MGDKCLFYKNHVFGMSLPEGYVEEVLKPPIDKMVKEDIPIRHSNQYTRDAKRGRR